MDPKTCFLVFGACFTGCLEKTPSICLCSVSAFTRYREQGIRVIALSLSVSLIPLVLVGSWLIVVPTFVVANIFFMVLDLTGKPAALLKYKIQEDKGVPVSTMAIPITHKYQKPSHMSILCNN